MTKRDTDDRCCNDVNKITIVYLWIVTPVLHRTTAKGNSYIEGPDCILKKYNTNYHNL